MNYYFRKLCYYFTSVVILKLICGTWVQKFAHSWGTRAALIEFSLGLLTFIQRLGQLGSHTPFIRQVSLQRKRDKERCVRRFGWWRRIPAANHGTHRVLSMRRNRPHIRMTATSSQAGCSSIINMAPKPRKQKQTPVYWHRFPPLVYSTKTRRIPDAISQKEWKHNTNLTRGHISLPTVHRTGLRVDVYKYACVKSR